MKPRKQRLHSAELRRLDRITEALERIAMAIENTPTRMEIDHVNNRINVNGGVGVQMGGESKVEDIHPNTAQYENFAPQGIAAKNIGNVDRSTEVDSDNKTIEDNHGVIATHSPAAGSKIDSSHVSISGDCGASATGGATATAISDVKSSFNTNANDVVKDLTEALHRSTVQRSEQQNKNNEP